MTTPYLTPDRFRTLGLGIDLDLLTDVELRSILYSASATVDAHCSVPRLPQPFSFLGGAVVDEDMPWDPGDYLNPMQRRFKVSHKPIKEVSSLRIHVTNQQYVGFDPADQLFIYPEIGVIEIYSLAISPYSVFGGAVVPGLGLLTPRAKISYTYGWDYEVTDEILEPTDAKTYSAQNQFWTDADVEVWVDDALVDPDDYTIDRVEGTIEFDTNPGESPRVTASYHHKCPPEIAQATGLIAAASILTRDLNTKGLGGAVRSLKVGEITIARELPRNSGGSSSTAGIAEVTPETAMKLAGFVFITVR